MDQVGGGIPNLPETAFAGTDYGFSASLYLPLAIGVVLFLFIMIKLAIRALDQFNPNPNRAPAVRRRTAVPARAENAEGGNRREQGGRSNRQPELQNEESTVRQRRPEQARLPQQRLASAVEANSDDSSNDSDDIESATSEAQRKFGNSGKRVGTKKLRKLQEKAERRTAHEAAQREREERRERERTEAEIRRQDDEAARLEETERREAEARLKAEREQREQEEYERLRTQFAVDESGQLELEGAEAENKLAEFVQYIAKRKVCMLDELANRFGMRSVTDAVDRIQQLLATGRLSGILDDRGKFIFVSVEEYEAAARLVRQAGRISIAELTEQLGRVINLKPDADSDTDDAVVDDEVDIDESDANAVAVN